VTTLTDLRALVDHARAEELPALAGKLREAELLAEMRLRSVTPDANGRRTEEDRLLAMPEVAERLGITLHHAREMGRRGELPVILVGERRVRIRATALEEWIRRRERNTVANRYGGR
jgi:excisionase family DNA binding protein